MDLRRRCVDLVGDKEILLEFHCTANYESDTRWARRTQYAPYRERWLSTSQPRSFLAALKESLGDERTIAELWENQDGAIVGYVWTTFTEIEGYGMVLAEIRDIVVVQQCRRQGIATRMLKAVSSTARKNGAAVLRSETGIENTASDSLHRQLGFTTHRMEYEKVLDEKAVTDFAEPENSADAKSRAAD